MASLAPTTFPVSPLTVLSEEDRLFQDTVRRFARQQIAPWVRQMDEAGEFRKDLLEQMFELGLMGIEIPEEFGGQGGSFFQAVLAIEELAAVDPAAAVIADVQNTLVNNALLRFANEEQKRRYLPRLAANTTASYALSEAGSGSDAFSLATRAIDCGDHFLLTGRKLWITNAAEAGLFLVFANVNPEAGYKGITCFLVERNFAGFQVGRKEDKLGIRASSTCEVILDNCPVPKSNVLGEVGKGYKIAIETLNEGRIAIGAQMTGLAQGALDHALAYAKQRKQFGKPIAEFQAVQFELAQMATDVAAARLLVYNAARLRERGHPFVCESAMAKYFASQVAENVASKAIEIFGGVGFTKDYPVEKLYRDAKIGRIYEGTTNMQLMTIAKQLLGR
ncbi:MAG: acyl-CoA dehydrogenase [Bryobacteraceae bacterium]|nr:acyl-CoA dehydrogenase [Bryobacteraceae bacterium]MDW8378547.1 acyl-CoA dehydrogenase [Bryobacterales bacterium]